MYLVDKILVRKKCQSKGVTYLHRCVFSKVNIYLDPVDKILQMKYQNKGYYMYIYIYSAAHKLVQP